MKSKPLSPHLSHRLCDNIESTHKTLLYQRTMAVARKSIYVAT